MLELKSRILLDNDQNCSLCGTRLELGKEAHKGYIVDSQESKILCERCSCIDDYYNELDLSADTDLLSVLCDIDYLKCDCGADIENLIFKFMDKDTIRTTCSVCGSVKDHDISLESLEDYFIEHSDRFDVIDTDVYDGLDDYEEYDEYEDYAKYTEDYIPELSIEGDTLDPFALGD